VAHDFEGVGDVEDVGLAARPAAAGVQVERGYGFGPRRIRNLSDRQREILRPKVNRRKVSV